MIRRFLKTFAYVLIHAVPCAVGYYFAWRMGWYHYAWIFGLVAIAVARAIAYPFIYRRHRRHYKHEPKEAHNDYHRRNRH